jgi:hypothetical protein
LNARCHCLLTLHARSYSPCCRSSFDTPVMRRRNAACHRVSLPSCRYGQPSVGLVVGGLPVMRA